MSGRRKGTIPFKAFRAYGSWKAMIRRCYTLGTNDYPYYGGRGITVCERWRGREGFPNFLADMGERPDGLTLDRRDSDGPYEPSNCRWATRAEQSENRHKFEFCRRGHRFDGVLPSGKHRCRTCVRDRMRLWRAAHAVVA